MAARKAVKDISVTIGSVSNAPVYSASVIDGRNTSNGEIAAYGDALFTTIASPVLHASDLTVDILDEGGMYGSIKSLVGTTQSVAINTTYWNGKTDDTAVSTVSGDCVILSAVGDGVAVDTDGRSLIHVTLRKQAE